jgi:hypothetical protein
MEVRAPRLGRRGQVLLFAAASLLFVLTGSRARPFADATPIWEVAEGIVRRGSVSIRTVWPPDLPRGRGGRVYAVAPLLQSLVHLPGAWGRWALAKVAPATAPHSAPFFSHLGPAALGGLTTLSFFLLVSRFVAPLAAALATGTLALGTFLWVYARSPYSEILQTACFLLFFSGLLRARAAPARRSALLLGAAAGALLASKPVYAVAIAGGMAWLLYALLRRGRPPSPAPGAPPAEAGPDETAPGERQALAGAATPAPLDARALLRFFGWVAAGAAPFVLLVLVYNYVRWGSLFDAGYALQTPEARVSPFGESVPVGLWGLFFSPGKSLFLYSPPLLVGLLALPRLYRRAPEVVALLLLTAAPVVLVYSRFLFWAGDYAWGPRYLVFLCPLLMLPAAVALDDVLRAPGGWRRRANLGVLGLAAVAGLGVQVLGVSFIWDHHIRIGRDVKEAWLGSPNRAGAAVPEREGLCGACFEDMGGQQWLPPLNPIRGHLWLFRHVTRQHPWEVAAKDAPWTRYTTIPFDLSKAYDQVRLDWWFFDLRATNLPVAIALLLLLLGGTTFTAWALVRHARAARAQ